MVKAQLVPESRKQVLYNLMQKYLYEMTAYYDDPMDDNGNYTYKYLPYYFTEEDRRAYFLYDEEKMIGFALINAHSFTGEPIDNCIAEFTIFPAYRRSGKGLEAIEALREARKGSWQLKYSTTNPRGAAFWQRVRDKFNGKEQKLDGAEIAITF